jgi:hypothetical protein
MDNFKRKLIMYKGTDFGGRKMINNATRLFCGILILTLSLALPDARGQEEESLSRGAVILAEKTDPVSFLDENNQSLGKAFSISGALLPEGTSVHTGAKGGALLLLSNGTIITISENTKMKYPPSCRKLSMTRASRLVIFRRNRVPRAYWLIWKSEISW